MDKEQPINLRVSAELHKKVQDEAKRKGISMCGLIRMIILEHLERSGSNG